METFGYGSLLVVDGYGASKAHLADENYALEVLRALTERLEATSAHALALSRPFDDGVSAGMALPESHLTLHTFAARRCLCLSVFSRWELPFEGVLEDFKGRFEVGRVESHLGSRSPALPQDTERALAYLIGERNYTDVRLDDALLVF